VIAFLRKPAGPGTPLLVVWNLTPVQRDGYRVGVPHAGRWRELLNSDAQEYGGSGAGNFGGVESTPVMAQGRANSLSLTLPALSTIVLRHEAA
jgi:1,4-alpha-glucan branching enzyme